jgi:DNA-binding response OmpR family regulator
VSILEGKRILLVEDEFLVAELTASILADFSIDVVGPAYNLAEGLRLADSDHLDGAVLDVNLGRGDRSDEIAAALDRRGVPYVFVTGYTGLAAYSLSAPMLDKPLDAQRLRMALEQLLG